MQHPFQSITPVPLKWQMNSEEETVLRAIVISSSDKWSAQPITQADRQAANVILSNFATFDGRIQLSLKWLQLPQVIAGGNNDCTLSAKLYACELLAGIFKSKYTTLSGQEKGTIRAALLSQARQQARLAITDSRVLANKVASLIAGIVVRDFPQRWNTAITDIFGALWSMDGPNMGVKICLEVLKLVAEDCTDSDYNAKVSRLFETCTMD